jgi:hypothetical protein
VILKPDRARNPAHAIGPTQYKSSGEVHAGSGSPRSENLKFHDF